MLNVTALETILFMLMASPAASAEPWEIIYAAVEPDHGSDGGHIRVVATGPEEDRIADALLNGISLEEAFQSFTRATGTDPDPTHQRVELTDKAAFLTFYGIHFGEDGAPEPLMRAGEPIWYRILPSGGGWTEVLIRLRHRKRQPITVALHTEEGFKLEKQVKPVPAMLEGQTQAARLGLATVNVARDTLYAYLVVPQSSAEDPVTIKSLKLDGEDVTPRAHVIPGYCDFGMIPLTISLKREWPEGSYHFLDCTLSDGQGMVGSIRAGNGFAVTMLGANFGSIGAEGAFEEFQQHYIDTWNAAGGRNPWIKLSTPDYQAVARRFGIRIQPNMGNDPPVPTMEDIRELARSDAYTHSYWLFDEPDVNDAIAKDMPIPDKYRLGLFAQQLVKLAEALRDADPVHPSILIIDKTYRPQNYYVYGQLADIMCADIYYPLGARDTNWDPVRYMYEDSKVPRMGFMPKPMMILVSASPDGGMRAPTPEEERIAIYASVAAGANSIGYYWYNAYKGHGCQWVEDTWAEIALLNRELQLLSPWVGVAFPIDLPADAPEKVWVRTVAAGPDALLVIIINKDHTSSPEGFTYTPMDEVSIELQLPRGFTVNSAASIEADGPEALSVSDQSGKAVLDISSLEVGRLVLLSRETDLLERLQNRW